jgi:glycosyltransferase involved in cell wall biosynthesis
MNILVIPSTDWVKAPVPNRLNFIFDSIAGTHEVFVLHYQLSKFNGNREMATRCRLMNSGPFRCNDLSLQYLLNAPFYVLGIRNLVREHSIDIIVSANIIPSFAASFMRVPVVFDYHDHLEESASVYYRNSPLKEFVEKVVHIITRYNLRHADAVITVTDEFREYLTGLGLTDIHVIPNGVSSDLLRPVPAGQARHRLGLDGLVLGYVGSLEYWVDLETVIEALPDLDATLLVVGPDKVTEYGSMIKRLAEERGVQDNLVFSDTVPYADLGLYISAMDVCLNPLKRMKKNDLTIGGKVFNYLSCAKPVLSSRMTALEHFFGNALFYYDDRESFLRQVRLIEQSGITGAQYRRIAEQHDWRALAGQYQEMLSAVKNRGGGA